MSLTLILLSLALAGIARFWPRPHLLTTITSREYSLVSGMTIPPAADLYWLTANQLLILTMEQAPAQILSPRNASIRTHWKGSADILHTDTGARIHLSGLTELLQQTTVYPAQSPAWFTMSPDGTWVLWEHGMAGTMVDHPTWEQKQPPHRSDYRTGVIGICGVAHLDGTHYRQWNIGKVDEEFFLDARHQVQMMPEEPLLVVHDLQNSNNDREYPKQEQAKTVLAQYATQHPVFVRVCRDPDDLSQFWIETYRTQDRLELLDPSSWIFGVPPLQKQRIKMPEGTTMAWADVSPHQQYISYSVKVSRESAVRKWLHRLVPKFDSKPMTTEELWISHADGRDMHEIGYVPSEAEGVINRLNGVKWLPDDKHLSFYYSNRLYVVPTGSRQ